MYIGKYSGWEDTLSEILPGITDAAGNIVRIFRPSGQSNISSPIGQRNVGVSSLPGLEQYIPWLVLAGIGIYAISKMGRK